MPALSSSQPRRQAPPAGDKASRKLSFNDAETKAIGKVFVDILAKARIDGAPIFKKLCDGHSLAEALEIPKGAVDILYARAHQWFAVGRADRAEVLFKALCVIAGETADHWVGYGVCLKMSGRLQEAGQAFAAAARLRADWAIPYFHLFEVYARSGDFARAGQALAAFDIRKDSTTPQTVLSEAERFREALAIRTGALAGGLRAKDDAPKAGA